MNSNDFIFHEIEDGIFERKCFGMEWLTGCTSEYLDGMTHLTISSSVKVPAHLSFSHMRQKCKIAWISSRLVVPGLACRSFKYDDKEGHYAKRYVVPKDNEDVEAWVSETFVFSDMIKTLEKSHYDLKDDHWWLQSSNKYVAELHVSPSIQADEWYISLSSVHNSSDGRSIFQLLEVYLDCLTTALLSDNDTTSTIVWGNEIQRLPPPASFAPSIVSTGDPPNLRSGENTTPRETPSPAPIPWLYPVIPSASETKGDLSRLIRFSAADTSKLHSLAKAKGRTVTQLFTAFTMIAHSEAAFKTAGKESKTRFDEILSSYEGATHYPTALNFINHRHKLPGGYASFKSTSCSPLVAYDGVPLLFPLDGVKQLLKVNKDDMTVTKLVDFDVFWGILVKDIADIWKGVDTSLEAYHERDKSIHEGLTREGFNPDIFKAPFGIVSSIGDLGRLNILDAYLPSTSEEEKIAVTDLLCGLRLRIPCFTNMVHQYNGELSCNLVTASEFTTPEAFRIIVEAFEEWAKVLL